MEKRKKKKEEDEEGQVEATAGPWESVPSDLLPEILSRVPYRSLCRFKCVSRAWLALCSDPAVRRRSPQTLSGFFCYSFRDDGSGRRRYGLDFLNLSGRGQPLVDPSLQFLRGYRQVTPLHCCGGILICYCKKMDKNKAEYVVCNPATEEIWAVLPVRQHELLKDLNTVRLCFDTAVPRRFTVFVFMHNFDGIVGVEVYSSEAGQWTSMQSEWSPETAVLGEISRCVFFDGNLHLATRHSPWIVTVDTEGKTWRRIQMPHGIDSSGFIGQSQGRLCSALIDHENGCQLSVWVLEDYASGLVAIHPERTLIYLKGGVTPEETLMSYDMDNKKLQVICSIGESRPWEFQPYIPCFVETPSDAHKQLNIC